MKKILSAILLLAMALTLFSCGAKPEFVEMDSAKISTISFTAITGIDIDKDTFVELYNKSEVVGSVKDGDKKVTDVIVVAMAGGEDHFTLYYVGDNKFAVTGSFVENEFVIKSEELSEFYNDLAHPTASFVSIDGEKVVSGTYTVYPDVAVDTDAVVKAYNDSEFVGAASTEKGNNVILLIYDDSKAVFEITFIEDDMFRVSGTLVKADYIIKSKALADIYADTAK